MRSTDDASLSWLLEPDSLNPGVRYFALRDLLDRSPDEPEVRQARAEIMTSGPVPAILTAIGSSRTANTLPTTNEASPQTAK